VHLGLAVLLLDGPDFWRSVRMNGLRADIREHFITSYLERIVPKLAGPVEVLRADRGRSLEPTGGR
jgi:hypothetical protein